MMRYVIELNSPTKETFDDLEEMLHDKESLPAHLIPTTKAQRLMWRFNKTAAHVVAIDRQGGTVTFEV